MAKANDLVTALSLFSHAKRKQKQHTYCPTASHKNKNSIER
jgi:hypothetical protein